MDSLLIRFHFDDSQIYFYTENCIIFSGRKLDLQDTQMLL